MKKLVFALVLSAAAFAQAADAKKDAYDIRPEAGKVTDGPTAVEWQNKNNAALAAATTDAALAAIVSDEASALKLLGQLRGAYATDPLAAFQMAAVTQWVMGKEPGSGKPSPAAGRKVWVQALLKTAETSGDAYVKVFCLDQLRWCGCACPKVAERIRGIGEKSGDKAVRDFVVVVLRELKA